MKQSIRKGTVLTAVILLILGAGLVLFARRGQELSAMVWAGDILFGQASVLLVWGFCLQLGNAHMFTSFTYSFHQIHRLFRNKQQKSAEMKEDYLAYRNSRRHHDDVPVFLIAGCVLLAASVLLSLLA